MSSKRSTRLVVLLCACVLVAPRANAATMSLVTDTDTYHVGDTFALEVKIDTEGKSINGAQATLKFDPTLFEAVRTDKTDSIFGFWITEPTIALGQMNFVAASITGYNGKSLEAVRVVFKAKAVGTGDLSITDAAVTASNGTGDNVLTKTNNARLTATMSVGNIVPALATQITRTAQIATGLPDEPVLSVPLYPDPAKWYNVASKFSASWSLPPDVAAVATIVDQDPNTTPTVGGGLFDSKSFWYLSDGVWYLHVRFKNNVGWGTTATYRIAIDTVPPTPFKLKVAEGLVTVNPAPHLSYASGDALSGLDHYTISVDAGSPTSTSEGTATLSPQLSGQHTVRVSAIDKAGNATEDSVVLHITEIPLFIFGGISVSKTGLFSFIIIILLAGFAVSWFMYRLWRQQLGRKVIIAQRDVVNTFATFETDVDALLEHHVAERGGNAHDSSETEYMLRKMKGDVAKKRKYMLDNLKEIAG